MHIAGICICAAVHKSKGWVQKQMLIRNLAIHICCSRKLTTFGKEKGQGTVGGEQWLPDEMHDGPCDACKCQGGMHEALNNNGCTRGDTHFPQCTSRGPASIVPQRGTEDASNGVAHGRVCSMLDIRSCFTRQLQCRQHHREHTVT